MLKENYPVPFVIFYSILLGLLAVLAIIIQILMIIYKSHNYQIGAGIWVGSYLVLAIILSLILIKKRSKCLYSISLLMNFIGFILSIVGLIITNAIGLYLSTNSYTAFNYAQISIGAICAIVCLSFVVIIQCLTSEGNCFKNTKENKNMVNFSRNRVDSIEMMTITYVN